MIGCIVLGTAMAATATAQSTEVVTIRGQHQTLMLDWVRQNAARQ